MEFNIFRFDSAFKDLNLLESDSKLHFLIKIFSLYLKLPLALVTKTLYINNQLPVEECLSVS